MLKPGRHKLISFARRTQGLIVAPGNPLGLHRLADLLRPGLRFAARGPNTGTRVVLDELLAAHHIDPAQVVALPQTEPSHRAAAEAVASGVADASFGIEAAARARGLGFVPLASEQYFLAVLRQTLDAPAVRTLLELLQSAEWQEQLNALPGYAAEHSGEVMSLRRVLPWWHYRKPKL
jgi:molybdate-binding protein